MEPAEDEEELHFAGLLTAILRCYVLESPLEIILHAGRRFVSDLET